jgi:2-polyprenyl-3-methyl-5-hydroxy-6-metoxy-1,4-benzoquinol methylase
MSAPPATEAIDATGLVCGDAQRPVFEDESFDLIVAGDVIEHVPDQDGFVAGCRRLLRPGGTLFLATPNRVFATKGPA